MCGIAGYAGFQNCEAAAEAVGAMTAALARRGPNGSGVEMFDGAAQQELNRQESKTPVGRNENFRLSEAATSGDAHSL